MKEYPKSYVYFALKGDDFDPSELTRRIGIFPTRTYRKGQSIGKSGNTVKFSEWYFEAEKSKDNISVDELESDLVNKLFDKVEIINELKRKYELTSILQTVLYIDCNEENSTPYIGHDLKTIEFLYKTKTETDVDIYRYDSSLRKMI